jgi:hypothetical protein
MRSGHDALNCTKVYVEDLYRYIGFHESGHGSISTLNNSVKDMEKGANLNFIAFRAKIDRPQGLYVYALNEGKASF